MKILQTPISENHKSAMFFDGVIAEDKRYLLATYQGGEIGFLDETYYDTEIIGLGKKGLINDADIELEKDVDVFVDKFICIYRDNVSDENLIYDDDLYFTDYDEAIKGFKEFLTEV